MCRHAAYIGPAISLAQCFLEPEHGLLQQAEHPREMRVGRVNADGFGIGWFIDRDKPAAYKNIQPIWSDTNLSALGVSLFSTQWIGLVRGASPGLGVSIDNTHPFYDNRWHFTLNGIITDFANTLRPAINNRLSDDISATIMGHTDAEFIFALMRQFSLEEPDSSTTQLLQKVVDFLEEVAGDIEIALSVLVCEKDSMYAIRHSVNLPFPTLYYSEEYVGGVAVASEPMTDRRYWKLMPEQSLLIAEANKRVRFERVGK
ncbi:MAG: class II glutamine amidotransferase [Pseudomonadota bacterium]